MLFGAIAAFPSKSVATIAQIAFSKFPVQAFARKRTDVLEIVFLALYAGQPCKLSRPTLLMAAMVVLPCLSATLGSLPSFFIAITADGTLPKLA